MLWPLTGDSTRSLQEIVLQGHSASSRYENSGIQARIFWDSRAAQTLMISCGTRNPTGGSKSMHPNKRETDDRLIGKDRHGMVSSKAEMGTPGVRRRTWRSNLPSLQLAANRPGAGAVLARDCTGACLARSSAVAEPEELTGSWSSDSAASLRHGRRARAHPWPAAPDLKSRSEIENCLRRGIGRGIRSMLTLLILAPLFGFVSSTAFAVGKISIQFVEQAIALDRIAALAEGRSQTVRFPSVNGEKIGIADDLRSKFLSVITLLMSIQMFPD